MPPGLLEQVAHAVAAELDSASDTTDIDALWEKLPVETREWAMRIAGRAIEAYLNGITGRRID